MGKPTATITDVLPPTNPSDISMIVEDTEMVGLNEGLPFQHHDEPNMDFKAPELVQQRSSTNTSIGNAYVINGNLKDMISSSTNQPVESDDKLLQLDRLNLSHTNNRCPVKKSKTMGSSHH